MICSEGELWKDQRKLAIEWMRKLGGAKHSTNRQRMADQIMIGVNEFINVSVDNVINISKCYFHFIDLLLKEGDLMHLNK